MSLHLFQEIGKFYCRLLVSLSLVHTVAVMLLQCRFECNRCSQLLYLLKHYIRMKLSSQMALLPMRCCPGASVLMHYNKIFLIFLPLLPRCGPACMICTAGLAPLLPCPNSLTV